MRKGSEVESGQVGDGKTKPGIWNQKCQNVDNGCLLFITFLCFPDTLQQTCSLQLKKKKEEEEFRKTARKNLK